MKIKDEPRYQNDDKYDSASDEESGFGSQEIIGEPHSDDDYSGDTQRDAESLAEEFKILSVVARGKDEKQKIRCTPYSSHVSTRNSFLQTGGTVSKPNFLQNYIPQTYEHNIPTTVQNYKQPTNRNVGVCNPPNIPNISYSQYPAQNSRPQYNFEAQNSFQNIPTSTVTSQTMNIGFEPQNDFLSAQNMDYSKSMENYNLQPLYNYTQNIPSEGCSKNLSCSKDLGFNIGASVNEISGAEQCYGAQNAEGSNFLSGSKIENYPDYQNEGYEGHSELVQLSEALDQCFSSMRQDTLNQTVQNLLDYNTQSDVIQNILSQDTTQNIDTESELDNYDILLRHTNVVSSSSGELPVLEINSLTYEVLQNVPAMSDAISEDYRDLRQSFCTESSFSNLGSPESCQNNWTPSPYSINSPSSSSSFDSSNIPSSSSSSPVWNPTYLDKVNIPTVIKDITPQKTAKQKMQEIADKKPLIKRFFWDDYSLKHAKDFIAQKNGLNLIQEIVKNEKKDLLIRVFAAVTNLLKYCQPLQVNQVFERAPKIVDLAKTRGIPLLYDYLSEIVSENNRKILTDNRNI